MNSIHTNWSEEYETNMDRWEFTTQIAFEAVLANPDDHEVELFNDACDYIGLEPWEVREDPSRAQDIVREQEVGIPMMNYRYPLYSKEVSDEKALIVGLSTSCAVVYDTQEEAYYLVLTGGGMNLSQSIAYAYLIVDERIPSEVAIDVTPQYRLNLSDRKWRELKAAIVKTLKYGILDRELAIDRWRKEAMRAQDKPEDSASWHLHLKTHRDQ